MPPLPQPDELLARFPPGVRDTIRASLDAAESAERGPRSTIEPDKGKGHRTLDEALALLSDVTRESALLRRATLGEGGMGVVHLAEQRSLGRDVAVKTVKVDARSAQTTLKLLREAWITGALEHPNVVPVHDVRLDGEGHPQIVLKKIEGKPWSELIADRALIVETFSTSDPVEWNLRAFLQVANAIHYAHTRGIVHRDIKPENVMIGSFGEVYVVDWGLALALRDDGTGRLPLARDAKELAGTPCYMAPEMLGGEAATIEERTDVYLLGATLFEIVTGAPPRDGPNILAVLAQVIEHVSVPSSVPAELARIIERAMALHPADRYPSAEALRVAVTSYLGHRGSIQLAEQAMGSLTELRALSSGASAEAGLAEEQAVRGDALFAECRFGFQQALRSWPENELARDGLKQALTFRIERELSDGNVAFASHLLTELPEADPELTRRVEEARLKDASLRETQAALSRDRDPNTGRRTRVFVGMLMGSTWVIAPLLLWQFGQSVPGLNAYPGAIAGTLALMGVGLALALWARDSLTKTAFNRQVVMTVTITLLSQLALLVGSYLADIRFDHAHTILVLTWGIATALTANALDSRLYISAVGFLVGFLLLTQWPEWRFPVSAASNLILTANFIFLWARVKDDVVEPVRRRVREGRERRASHK